MSTIRLTAVEIRHPLTMTVSRAQIKYQSFCPYILTWDQAQFERFPYILSNGYRWNWAWYKLLQVCARYGQILAVTLIGCRKRRKLKALIPLVVFVNDPPSAERSRKVDFADSFIVWWSYGRKICLSKYHGNSEKFIWLFISSLDLLYLRN